MSSQPVNIYSPSAKLSTSSISSTGSSSGGGGKGTSSNSPPIQNAPFLSHHRASVAGTHSYHSGSGAGEPHSGFGFPSIGSPVVSGSGFLPMATSTPSIPNAANSTNNSSHTVVSSSKSIPGRRRSLNVVFPKFSISNHNGSTKSLNKTQNSTGSIHGDDTNEEKERSYKVQRKNYRKEKQRVTEELNIALKDPSIIILSGALKVRGKLKGWTKLWAILKPGLLLLYKSNKIKSSHWVATVLLHCCKIIQRPTKKEGFCFKVFHPLDHSIWATKGPDGEAMGAVVQPLPTTYLICRAPSADDGKYWMDGLELALTCSSLLVRTPRSCSDIMEDKSSSEVELETGHKAGPSVISSAWKYEVSDDEEKNQSDNENDSDTSIIEEVEDDALLHDSEDEEGLKVVRRRKSATKRHSTEALVPPKQSNYILSQEDFSAVKGEQSEELADENKSLLWFLIKQVRPGMDLSRVVLPTFILEPRSFLDKLSDYYYHADYLSKAVAEDDPFTRMKSIVRWYLSGFYKKPKGLKKPYNPVLGETFRCLWTHPNGSKTFYIAEQVSHHPPVSAFYVSNKKDGFVISASITAKSKFYGNSTSAILDGVANLTLLPRGEAYTITMPFAHCKGILLGTLSMELGGHVTIACAKTGYTTEMEFKLKSFLSRADHTNGISGKIKLGRETLATIDGHWDNKIHFKDKRSFEEEILWDVTEEIKAARLVRYAIPLEEQNPNESEKLWIKVSEAIGREDQDAATVEKTVLEEQQRKDVKDRITRNVEWTAQNFIHDGTCWRYRYEDLRPWDERNDIFEYECNFVIATHRKLETPVIRTCSLVSVNSNQCDILRDVPSDKLVPGFHQRESNRQLVDLLRQLLTRQIEQSEQIEQLKEAVAGIQAKLAKPKEDPFRMTNTILVVVFAVALQLFAIIFWFGDGKLIPQIKRPKMPY